MRKVTQQAAQAFNQNINFKSGNTQVEVLPWWDGGTCTNLRLHCNIIACKFSSTGAFRVTNAGWQSNTTKERLNGLPGVSISQKAGVWYLNGNVWDGSLITV